METGFTPGPWTINPDTPSSIMTPDGRIAVSWTSNDGVRDLLAEKYARRIAALPDLLEALKDVLGFASLPIEGDPRRPAFNRARAAIAKAEGRG